MENIQINEEALLEWRQKNYKKTSWVDKLYLKTNHYIFRYFHEVSCNYKEWKKRMMASTYGLKYYSPAFKNIYFPTGFSPYFFHQKDYVRFRTRWDAYAKMANEPTITGFVEFQRKWPLGVEKTNTPPGNITDFEAMFINA
jgi:hypothetical protein